MNTSMVEATDPHRPSADSLPPHRGNVVIQTHGCKLNQADSDALARQFVEAGYQLVESVRDADIYVLNTCTVTATADSKARQALRAARRANPRSLTGSASSSCLNSGGSWVYLPTLSRWLTFVSAIRWPSKSVPC